MLGREQLRKLGLVDRRRVREGLLEQPVGAEPPRGAPVQLPHGLWTGRGKLDPEKLAEQVVVAIPDAASIERDEEQVRALDLGENPGGALRSEDGVAEWCGKTVENRRTEQEAQRFVVDGVEHLGCEVVGEVTVVGGALPYPLAWRVMTGEP